MMTKGLQTMSSTYRGNRPLRRPSIQVRFAVSQTGVVSVFRKQLTVWFRESGRQFPWREKRRSNYQKVIAELLLQRTRAETVSTFYHKFLSRFPSWDSIDRSDRESVEEILRPIGLYRRRASAMKALAGEMVKRQGRFPITREEVGKLPGIGQYMASAILLLCHKQAEALLDGGVARLLERYFGPRQLADIRYDPMLQHIAARIVACSDPVRVNWALLDLSALICTKRNPRCNTCPLARSCRFALRQRRGGIRGRPLRSGHNRGHETGG